MKYYDLSHNRNKITVKHLNIDVGEKFKVHLNNPRGNNGEQASGKDHKDFFCCIVNYYY